MKNIIVSGLIGWIGGLAGAAFFQPINGIFSLIVSDFSIGGIFIGLVSGYFGLKSTVLSKQLLYTVGIGVVIFAIFGLLSGSLGFDIFAGAVIGLLVGLVSHFLGRSVKDAVDQVDEMV